MELYTATFVAHAMTAQEDVFEIVAPSDSYVELWEIKLGQYSDFGDAQAEILSVQVIRGHGTASNGAPVTPNPLFSGGKAAGSTVLVNGATVATGGTPLVMLADVMNVQAGYLYQPAIPSFPNQSAQFNERIKLAPSERAVVRVSAPADSLTFNGTLVFRELGKAI